MHLHVISAHPKEGSKLIAVPLTEFAITNMAYTLLIHSYLYKLETRLDYKYVQVQVKLHHQIHASFQALMPDTWSNSCRKSADLSEIQCYSRSIF